MQSYTCTQKSVIYQLVVQWRTCGQHHTVKEILLFLPKQEITRCQHQLFWTKRHCRWSHCFLFRNTHRNGRGLNRLKKVSGLSILQLYPYPTGIILRTSEEPKLPTGLKCPNVSTCSRLEGAHVTMISRLK